MMPMDASMSTGKFDGRDLWHVREEQLPPGTVVEPGRWGRIITSQGQPHPFYREQFLELYRVTQTPVAVSRLACTFAFEDRKIAEGWSAEPGQFLHRVEPVDADQARVRADVLWVTWMGEAAEEVLPRLARVLAEGDPELGDEAVRPGVRGLRSGARPRRSGDRTRRRVRRVRAPRCG